MLLAQILHSQFLHALPASSPLQASCYDACRDCRNCMGVVAGLPARLAALNGDTSKYAAAVADFCLKVGGWWLWGLVRRAHRNGWRPLQMPHDMPQSGTAPQWAPTPPPPPPLPQQNGGDYWTCQQALRTVAAHPEAATRPAALCKALYKCRWGGAVGWVMALVKAGSGRDTSAGAA